MGKIFALFSTIIMDTFILAFVPVSDHMTAYFSHMWPALSGFKVAFWFWVSLEMVLFLMNETAGHKWPLFIILSEQILVQL